MKMLGLQKVRLIEGITGRRVRCAYKGRSRWARVHYADGYGEEPRWVDYTSGETRAAETAGERTERFLQDWSKTLEILGRGPGEEEG